MIMHVLDRAVEPVRHHAREVGRAVTHRPKSSIGGIVLFALLVAFGFWIWPEIHRTVHIHRM